MQVTDELIRSVVQEVLASMRNGQAAPPATASNGQAARWGVFDDVDSAVAAAARPSSEFERRGLDDRRKAVDCIRKICIEQAETARPRGAGRDARSAGSTHKIEKLKVIADRIPGVEFLRTDAFSGENGVTLQEYAPFGVIGVITPVTHSLPTLACNAINMLAAGNAIVCNPHPSGARIACKGVAAVQPGDPQGHRHRQSASPSSTSRRWNRPRRSSTTATYACCASPAARPSAGPLCAARSGPSSPARAIRRSSSMRPPTSTTPRSRSSSAAAYDNNLLCIGEKEVFAVAAIFDELMEAMTRYKAVRLDAKQIEALTKAAFVKDDKGKLIVNKDLIGQDAAVLAEAGGLKRAGRHRAAVRRDRRVAIRSSITSR